MTVADIIDTAIRIYRHNFGPILAIAAIVQVPMVALQGAAMYYLMRTMLQAEGPDLPLEEFLVGAAGFGGAFLVALLLLPLGEAALAVGISERYLGRPITVSGAYQVALRYWPRVLWTSMLYWGWAYLWFLVGLIFLIIPGPVLLIMALVRYLPAGDVIVVLENVWGRAALRRSWHLTAGYGWSIFAALAILVLMVAVATYGVTVPLQLVMMFFINEEQYLLPATVIYQALQATVTVILQPLWMIGTVLIYYDLRIRKEGFDLLMMAEALNVPPPAASEDAPAARLYPDPEPPPQSKPPGEEP